MRSIPAIALFLALPLFATAADDKGTEVKLSKLSGTTPADWKKEKPANLLRTYQFKLPGGEMPEAEVAVFNEGNPMPEKNYPRWKGQFVPPEGKTTDDISKTTKWDVKGATVTVLELTGTWKYKERPQDPKSKEVLLEDYKVIWVIVAEKDEAHHIRLSGPAAVVETHRKGFEGWVKGLK